MMGCRDCSEIKPQIPQKSSFHFKALVSKQARIDSNGKPSTSLRWNPTPEQLFALEELYRCGTRTPSAQHIQQITSHLLRFGKIEGKNVFYWFQNHKARERQKQSREFKCISREKHWNAIGMSRNSQESQQGKMWMSHVKSLPNQEALSVCRAATAKETRHFRVLEGVVDDGLASKGKQATWKSMSPPNPSSTRNTLLTPSSQVQDELLFPSMEVEGKAKRREIQTLELFPLESSTQTGNVEKAMDGHVSSGHFFNFLSLRN